MTDTDETEKAEPEAALAALTLTAAMPTVHVWVVGGPDRGLTRALVGARLSIGSHERNGLVLRDPRVSRFHCEIVADDGPLRVRDLASTNGTFLDAVPILEAYVRAESSLRLGDSTLLVRPGPDRAERRVSGRSRFGGLVGQSLAMRALFADLKTAASTGSTVLLSGETGTGKDEAARAIHAESERAAGPFVVIDCGALNRHLIESELFGHERGAFTGALESRAGAFEAAHRGTVLLDEIGELPLPHQTKLLRVLETRTIRRLGSTGDRPVDVRIIAATHADLRRAVNEGRFREDLYYRLAVLEVRVPSLRERLEDLPLLARALLERIAGPGRAEDVLTPELFETLAAATWPGNVRQLRNYLERVVYLREDAGPPGAVDPMMVRVDSERSWDDARRLATHEFERRFLVALLAKSGDNVAEAARRAGMDRSYLHKLLTRHRLRE